MYSKVIQLYIYMYWHFPIQLVKNLPAIQDTWVWFLGQEDDLEKEMAVFLPGEFHGQRSLVGYSPWAHRVRHN